MKKYLALLLAVAMILAGLPAQAEKTPAEPPAPSALKSVYARFSVDRGAAEKFMAELGVPAAQAGRMNAVFAVLSALGIRVAAADGGVQADLELNGTGVLSFGAETAEGGLAIGSSLFPDYIITVSRDTVMSRIRKRLSGISGLLKGKDRQAAAAAALAYAGKFAGEVMKAIVPGTPEKAEFDVGGCAFDTRTPVSVDTAALAGAIKGLITDLLKNETISGLLRTRLHFDTEKALKALEERLAEERIPDAAAEVYTRSGSNTFYAVCEAAFKGAADPAYRITALRPGDGTGDIRFQAFETGASIGLSVSRTGLYADYITEKAYYALRAEMTGARSAGLELYAMDTEKPLLSLAVTGSPEGKRTLSLSPEGRQAVRLEDLTGPDAAGASAGLAQSILQNLAPLMMKIAEAVPEAVPALSLPAPAEQAP